MPSSLSLALVLGLCLVFALEGTGQATRNSYDFVVVGAGSAGSLVAGELAKTCRRCTILIIEAGGDPTEPVIHDTLKQPLASGNPAYSFLRDDHVTIPQTNYYDKSIPVARGKVLGGSMAINAMYHVLGNPWEWDTTAAEIGDNSWTWANTQKYRKKIAKEFPLFHHSKGNLPGHQAYIDAITGAGFNYETRDNDGVNGLFSSIQICSLNPTRPGAIRKTSFDLKIVDAHPSNVELLTYHQVIKVLIDENKVATGVQVLNLRSGANYTYNATKEVILSGGAYRTPQLLLLSGVGPAAHLQDNSIPVVLDLPGVGSHLNDHLGIQTFWQSFVTPQFAPVTFNSPSFEFFGPETTGRPSFEVEMASGFMSVLPTNIQLEGTVRLNSSDKYGKPLIDYAVDNRHEDAILIGVKTLIFPIAQALSAAGLQGVGFSLNPGASDETIRNYIRGNLRTNFHPGGSARVGPANDPTSVVDSRFRVQGISRLRVVDASVFRHLPTGNINSPTLTLAYFAADLIAKDNGN